MCSRPAAGREVRRPGRPEVRALRAGALTLLALCALLGCAGPKRAPADWEAWQARRNASIGGTNGWLTLVGLHWLREGDNSAGSDPANSIVLQMERLPGRIGVFTRHGKSVTFRAGPGVDVRTAGHRVEAATLQTDANPNPTKLELGRVSIVVIERGERIGLRIRDADAVARQSFHGLQWFPYDPAWRMAGHFEAFPAPRQLRVPDVTGATQEFVSPGALVFTVRGRAQRLDAIEEDGESEYFIIFRDATNGGETYGGGRFLYVPKPDAAGRVTLDFNRAHTPPCGFTSFATCPTPPRQNELAFPVRAGELRPATAHH